MRVNLIPMAGEGQRFINAGYSIPKPLMDISGIPMVVRAARSLPPADKWIFVVRDTHVMNSDIESVLRKHFDGVEIVIVDHLTEGQAMTCMLARDQIPDDAVLTIGPSDNDMTYSLNTFDDWIEDPNIDGWVWTFRNNPAVLQDPNMYGWVRTKDDNSISGISCKVPISSEPIQDHAVIGAFTFKKASIFFSAVESMISEKDRVNGEYYVDVAIEHAIRLGNRMRPFEVNHYICWGTPVDFETYNYWLNYFRIRGGIDVC